MDRHFSGLNSRMNLIYQSIGSGGAEWLPFSQPPDAIDAVASQPNHEFKKLVQLQRQNDERHNDERQNDERRTFGGGRSCIQANVILLYRGFGFGFGVCRKSTYSTTFHILYMGY